MYIMLGEWCGVVWCGVVWCGVVCGACIVYGRSPGIHWLLTAASSVHTGLNGVMYKPIV